MDEIISTLNFAEARSQGRSLMRLSINVATRGGWAEGQGETLFSWVLEACAGAQGVRREEARVPRTSGPGGVNRLG